jgi:predicted permease
MTQLRQALRQLRLSPGLSLTVIAMLALGIGATTAMFSVFERVLLQPLPVPSPVQLVNLGAPGQKWGTSSMCGQPGTCDYTFTYPMFRDLELKQTVFAGIAAHRTFAANLAYDRRAATGNGLLVSGSYFDVLGLTPALGRLIGRQDEPKVGEGAVVVLGYEYWRSYFGADPNIINRTLTVNGHALTIIGVAPEGFAGTTLGYRPRVYVPITLRWLMEPTALGSPTDRSAYWVYLFARLLPGVSIEGAKAQVGAVYHAIINEVEAPQNAAFIPAEAMLKFRARELSLEPGARGQSTLPGQAMVPTTLLLGVTALVLLLVCANIANLLLARGSARAGEMAIRASLGAGRGHLLQQALLESCVLAIAGGLASVPVALVTLRGVRMLLPPAAENLDTPLSGAALLFAGVMALATLLLFGLAPAIKASRSDPGLVMKGQAQQSVGGHGARRFRVALATAQIALSTVLLVLAGLFTQSLGNLAQVDLGMNASSVATFSLAPRRNGYSQEQAARFYERLEAELSAQPGVLAVASSMVPLLSGRNWNAGMSIEGRDRRPPGPESVASMNSVSPNFFRALAIPLALGREFADSDGFGKSRVAIVNEAFLRKFDLGSDALGKHIGTDEKPDLEIVGVVADTRYSQVRDPPPAQFFVPRQQTAFLDQMTFYVRAAVPAETLLTLVPRVVASLDPELPVDRPTTLRQVIDDNVFIERMVALLSAGFAALATVLAAVGLYGVLSFFVTQRTREIGLRLALGATPGGLRAMLLKQVAFMAGIGVPLGLALAAALGRAAQALLFGLNGYDPLVLGAAVLVVGTVVILAAYLPAKRAVGIAPMEALRSE